MKTMLMTLNNNNNINNQKTQPKLHSLIDQITNANDVTDIEPIINHYY